MSKVLNDPIARQRFRDFLVSSGARTAELDLWIDLNYQSRLIEKLRKHVEAVNGKCTVPHLLRNHASEPRFLVCQSFTWRHPALITSNCQPLLIPTLKLQSDQSTLIPVQALHSNRHSSICWRACTTSNSSHSSSTRSFSRRRCGLENPI